MPHAPNNSVRQNGHMQATMPQEDELGSIPPFLLKRLYVKGSLKNIGTGFELAIQNTLAPGTIAGLVPLKVDGIEYPLEQIQIVLPNDKTISAAMVSGTTPLSFAVGVKVIIRVESSPLPMGTHKLVIAPKTREAGILEIIAEDTIG